MDMSYGTYAPSSVYFLFFSLFSSSIPLYFMLSHSFLSRTLLLTTLPFIPLLPLSLPPFLSPSLPPSLLFLSFSLLPSLTQIRKIVSQIRPDRQTLMWSATWPKEVCPVVRVLLHYICRRIINYTSFCPSLCLSVSLSLTPTHSPSLSLPNPSFRWSVCHVISSMTHIK